MIPIQNLIWIATNYKELEDEWMANFLGEKVLLLGEGREEAEKNLKRVSRVRSIVL